MADGSGGSSARAGRTGGGCAGSAGSSGGGAAPQRDPGFYAAYPYAAPSDILPYIQQRAAPGNAQAVLDAMDEFSLYYPQYKIGPEKGALLEQLLEAAPPSRALEVGTFLGYSAIRIARRLRQPGGALVCVEANPQNAAVARQVLRHAGLDARVQVLDGLSSQVIPRLPLLLQLQQQQQEQQQQQDPWQQQQQDPQQQQQQQDPQRFDLVFLDHAKDAYLPDLQRLEALGLLGPGSTLVADNVVYPGAPGFLEYLASSGRYTTRLLRARYEYEQAWNPDWEAGKEDALSVSVCQAAPDSGA